MVLIHLNKNNLVAINRLFFLGLTNLEVVYLKDNPIFFNASKQSFTTLLDKPQMQDLLI
jgi:hypothetical protein